MSKRGRYVYWQTRTTLIIILISQRTVHKMTALQNLLLSVRRFLNDRRGVTAIEYGILAAGVAVVIGALVADDGALSNAISDLFDSVVAQLPEGGKGK